MLDLNSSVIDSSLGAILLLKKKCVCSAGIKNNVRIEDAPIQGGVWAGTGQGAAAALLPRSHVGLSLPLCG